MPDLEDVRDLWEIDLELAGSDQGPIPIISSPPEKTWVWSDLHFGDRSALYAFQRPFGNVDQMNRHLLREWRHRVRSDDTIICLGDVAHPDAGPSPPHGVTTLRTRRTTELADGRGQSQQARNPSAIKATQS